MPMPTNANEARGVLACSHAHPEWDVFVAVAVPIRGTCENGRIRPGRLRTVTPRRRNQPDRFSDRQKISLNVRREKS